MPTLQIGRADFLIGEQFLAGAFLGIPLDLIFMGGFFPPGGFANDVNLQEHESWAIFGQADFNLTDNVLLTAGLRYSDENKKLKTIYTESGDELGFITGDFPPTTKRPNVDEEIDDDQVTIDPVDDARRRSRS